MVEQRIGVDWSATGKHEALSSALLAAVCNRALYDAWLTTAEATKQAMREARHYLNGSPFYTKWDKGVMNAAT